MTTPWTWVYFQRPGFTLYQEDDKILTATDQTIERAQALRDMAARRVPGLHSAPYDPAGYEYCACDGLQSLNLFARDDVTPRTVVMTEQGYKTLAQVLTDYEVSGQGIDPNDATWDIQALLESVCYANSYTLTRREDLYDNPLPGVSMWPPIYWTLTCPGGDTEYVLRTCYKQGTPEGNKPTIEVQAGDANAPYYLASLPKECIPLFDGTGAPPTQKMLRVLARAADDAIAAGFCLERDIQGVAYALTRGGKRLEFYLENVGSFTYTGDDFVAHETYGDPAYAMGRSMLVKSALRNYGMSTMHGVWAIIDSLVRQKAGQTPIAETPVDGYRAARNGEWDVRADARTPYTPSRSTHPETRGNDPYSTYDRYAMHYVSLIKADAANMTAASRADRLSHL